MGKLCKDISRLAMEEWEKNVVKHVLQISIFLKDVNNIFCNDI